MIVDAIVKKYDNYSIIDIKENKFKTNSLVFSYKYKTNKNDFLYFYVLTALLFLKNNKYNTKRKYNNKILDLYNPRLNCSFSTSGKYIIFRTKITFLKEKYTEKGMDKKSINFFFKSLFEPYIVNEEFDNETFNTEIRRICDDIKSIKDNPDSYSRERLKQVFNMDTSFCYTLMDKDEEIKKLTSKELYLFYKRIINNGELIISFIGDTNFNYIKAADGYLKNRNNEVFNENHMENLKVRKQVNEVVETISTSQSRLNMLYIYDELTDFECKYVLRVLDFILGGSADSKLFKEVREKNSLCYRISSGSNMLNNTMIIRAGINAQNYEKTKELIEKQISSLKKGDFDDEDIEKAIISYKTACKEILDSPLSIVSSYLGKIYGTSDLLDERKKNIEKVTKKDVIVLANKLHLDTIYFLKGDE